MSEVSWIKKAVNFTLASVKFAADGFHTVSEADYEKRLSICHACPELSPEQECRVCGCPASQKAAWSSERCPLDKWLAHPERRNAQEGPQEARQGPPKASGGCNCGKSVPPRLGQA